MFYLILLTLSFLSLAVFPKEPNPLKQKIILESISQYQGNCPCPYSLTKNGKRCGARSAYSRAGGYAPLCYEEDITPELIKLNERSR
jgi:hypothetical protein